MAHDNKGWTPKEIEAYLARTMSYVIEGDPRYEVEAAGDECATVRMKFSRNVLRPGETISGASMMTLADLSVYVALLGALGAGAEDAVTAQFGMNFLRRPAPGDLLANVRLIRRGRRLAVAEVDIVGADDDKLLARGHGTYFMAS